MAALHRVRDSLIRQRVKTTHQRHAFLLASGVSLPRGIAVIRRLAAVPEENNFPPYLAGVLNRLHSHYVYLSSETEEVDKGLKTHPEEDETAQRLLTIPGAGPVTAGLSATRPGEGKHYAGSRDFAASAGRVPRQYSTDGKTTVTGAVCMSLYAATGT